MKENHDVEIMLVEGGVGVFGPAVDRHYVPDILIRLLTEGRYHRGSNA